MLICEGCAEEVDPDTCWCGNATSDHGEASGHPAVPMGCRCFAEWKDAEDF